MSDRDNPPPDRNDRTIIRPNPGGRRSVEPARPPSRPDAGQPPPSAWPQDASRLPSGPSYTPAPRLDRRQAGAEDWIEASGPAAKSAVPRKSLPRIDELSAPSANAIMEAASPLLLMLGRLRASLLTARFAVLMDQVAQAIKKFEIELQSTDVPREQATTAKYILCATADDIVQNIPSDDRHEWSRHSMLSSFFGERTGGVRFFELVDSAKADPVVNYPLMELMHACLALGFQGRFRSEGGGFANLQLIQRNLYETMRRVRPRTARDLSPHWQGQALAARKSGLHVPVWSVSAVLALSLVGLFLVLRYLLSGGAEAASAATLALVPHTPIEIARKVYAPPPPPPPPTPAQLTQLQRIRAALAPEIKAGTISVPDPTGPSWIVINVGSLLLFRSGEATVIPKFNPLADRIRAMLEHETGTIKIIGHTDNTKLNPASAFKSNFDLSVVRAHNVGAILQNGFSKPDRFQLSGKGADEPIADNKTEEGRQQNRRVEILVQRTD
jgi:type VI secretion system protein ImpK